MNLQEWNFNKITLQLSWHHTSASIFSCKFEAKIGPRLLKKTSGDFSGNFSLRGQIKKKMEVSHSIAFSLLQYWVNFCIFIGH